MHTFKMVFNEREIIPLCFIGIHFSELGFEKLPVLTSAQDWEGIKSLFLFLTRRMPALNEYKQLLPFKDRLIPIFSALKATIATSQGGSGLSQRGGWKNMGQVYIQSLHFIKLIATHIHFLNCSLLIYFSCQNHCHMWSPKSHIHSLKIFTKEKIT